MLSDFQTAQLTVYHWCPYIQRLRITVATVHVGNPAVLLFTLVSICIHDDVAQSSYPVMGVMKTVNPSWGPGSSQLCKTILRL